MLVVEMNNIWTRAIEMRYRLDMGFGDEVMSRYVL